MITKECTINTNIVFVDSAAIKRARSNDLVEKAVNCVEQVDFEDAIGKRGGEISRTLKEINLQILDKPLKRDISLPINDNYFETKIHYKKQLEKSLSSFKDVSKSPFFSLAEHRIEINYLRFKIASLEGKANGRKMDEKRASLAIMHNFLIEQLYDSRFSTKKGEIEKEILNVKKEIKRYNTYRKI